MAVNLEPRSSFPIINEDRLKQITLVLEWYKVDARNYVTDQMAKNNLLDDLEIAKRIYNQK